MGYICAYLRAICVGSILHLGRGETLILAEGKHDAATSDERTGSSSVFRPLDYEARK